MAQQKINATEIATGAVTATIIADGSITTAKLASGTLDTANSAASYANAAFLQANTPTHVANSAASYANAAFAQANTDYTTISASAGTYGNASAIPSVTIAANGRITGITTNAVSGGVTSLNGETGAITNTSLGAIGSYIAAIYAVSHSSSSAVVVSAGTTVSGSSLRYNPSFSIFNPLAVQQSGDPNYGGGGTSLSGTWRAVESAYQFYSNPGYYTIRWWVPNMWVRVS